MVWVWINFPVMEPVRVSGAQRGMTIPPPKQNPHDAAAKIAQQTKVARAAQRPVKLAPKAQPPESGKPVWDKPHSP